MSLGFKQNPDGSWYSLRVGEASGRPGRRSKKEKQRPSTRPRLDPLQEHDGGRDPESHGKPKISAKAIEKSRKQIVEEQEDGE